MKPVVVNPSLSFTQLLDELARVTEPEQRALIRDQLLVRLRRRVARLSPEAAEQFAAAAEEETPADVLARVQTDDPSDLASWIATRPGLGPILDWQPDAGRPVPLAVSFHPDTHVATTIGYGAAGRPEDAHGPGRVRFARQEEGVALRSPSVMIHSVLSPKPLHGFAGSIAARMSCWTFARAASSDMKARSG
jgi:hypothetical protein